LGALKAKSFANWHFFHQSSIGGIKHLVCQPQEHLSQINIMVAPDTYPHNMHNRPKITTTNGSTHHEHASQGFHVVLGKAQPSLVHLPTSVRGNYLPI
jgi:hypothetical protein